MFLRVQLGYGYWPLVYAQHVHTHMHAHPHAGRGSSTRAARLLASLPPHRASGGGPPSAVTGTLGAALQGLSDARSPKVTALQGNRVSEPGVGLTDLNPGRGSTGSTGN